MMIRTIILIVGFALAQLSNAESSGQASCKKISKDVGCEIQWKFPQARDREYRVQTWNSKAGAWEELGVRAWWNHVGRQDGAVAAGHLYRVLACGIADNECESSTAVWAPIWDSTENIPDTIDVTGPNGEVTFAVTKADHNGLPHTWSENVTQYNMYLLHQEALSFFMSDAEMPVMKMPKMKGEAPDTVDEMIEFNVAAEYEKIRSDVLALRDER